MPRILGVILIEKQRKRQADDVRAELGKCPWVGERPVSRKHFVWGGEGGATSAAVVEARVFCLIASCEARYTNPMDYFKCLVFINRYSTIEIVVQFQQYTSDPSQLNPFCTAVPIWGQTTQTPSGLSPKRDYSSKWVKER